jgi:Frequency clock protein
MSTVSIAETPKSHQLTIFLGEPPFYLNLQDNGPTPAYMSTDRAFAEIEFQATKEDSENDDLRSVIDDLTIENKRLRQLLRERRSQHDPLLDHDKIFEVRTCGLSSEKKRELETILQRFATTISSATSAPSAPSKVPMSRSVPGNNSSTFSEQTNQKLALYPPTDSAYASMSISGLTSAGASNRTTAELQRGCGSKSNCVKSYLQDIPDSLLPKHPPVMSEKSKMRLVVKRLEQLFTGTNAAPGEHSQPLQQQKVSESAANADRHASQLLEHFLQPEGTREAHILPVGAKVSRDQAMVNGSNKQPLGSRSDSEVSSDGKSASGNRSPDQRPTRPLDLDIQRAQVAQENIEYIRHLGLATPTRQRNPGHDDDGWVYLNLLINMAQLHTVNVTPAFVRKSIASLSTKFELSKDARKVRWRAGSSGADSSEESDSCAELTTGSSPELTPDLMTDKLINDNAVSDNLASTSSSHPQVRRQLGSLPSERNPFTDSAEPSMPPSRVTGRPRPESAFGYKPMFLKDRAMLQENVLLDESNFTPSAQGTDESTGAHPSTRVHGVSHNFAARSEEDGPIIFYNNPLFYCDMSGNKDEQAHTWATTTVPSARKQVLGSTVRMAWPDDEHQQHILRQFESTTRSAPDDSRLPLLELAPLSGVINNQSTLLELSASGIGGVVPDDHFILRVQRKRQYAPRQKRPGAIARTTNEPSSPIVEDFVSSKRHVLPASKLPPPSYVFFALSSGSSGCPESDASSSDGSDASDAELLEQEQSGRSASLKRFSDDTSGQLDVTDEHDVELELLTSSQEHDPLEDTGPHTNADQGFEYGHAAEVHTPGGYLTGSLAATVGATSAASVASNCSARSSRESLHGEWDTRTE